MLSKKICRPKRTAWPAAGITAPAGPGPGALWVNMNTLAGVTAHVSKKRPRAALGPSAGKADATGGSAPNSTPAPPATSATPVQLTWKLALPGRYQRPHAPLQTTRQVGDTEHGTSVKRKRLLHRLEWHGHALFGHHRAEAVVGREVRHTGSHERCAEQRPRGATERHEARRRVCYGRPD